MNNNYDLKYCHDDRKNCKAYKNGVCTAQQECEYQSCCGNCSSVCPDKKCDNNPINAKENE